MNAEGHHGAAMALADDKGALHCCPEPLEGSGCRTSCRSRCQRCILSGRIECQFCKMSSSLVPSSRQRTWTRFSYLQDARAASDTRDTGDGTDEYLRALHWSLSITRCCRLAQLSIVLSPDWGIGNHHGFPAKK